MRERRRGVRYPLSGARLGRARRFLGTPLTAAALLVFAWAVVSPASSQETAPPVQLAQQSQRTEPKLTLAPTISARPAARVPLDIRIAPADALPKGTFVRVRGLPPAVSLSEGYVTAPGSWAVPLYALANLQLLIPTAVTGRSEVTVSLVNEEGASLGEAKTALVIEAAAPPLPAPPPQASRTEPTAPAQPRPPVLSHADREAAEKLVARGERELEQGQVAVARQFFLRAAQTGFAPGALLLAATYDPRELTRWRVQGVQPNLDEARKWYQRARELGATEAEERLARLGGS